MLKVENLSVSHGAIRALHEISFNVEKGQLAAVIGANGAGKTTLLRSIAGLIAPSDGTIRFGKQLVSLSSLVMPPHKRKIGYVPQEGALFPHLSVADNIAFGLDRSVFTKDQIRQTTKEMLTLIGLQGYENRMPNQLSGGQQTRVALARALAIKPAIVLLDEPKTNSEYIYYYKDGKQPTKGTPYNTAGWTSVEVAGNIIERIGPILATKHIEN